MPETAFITRVLRAAEAWERTQHQDDVIAIAHDEPVCCADGRIQTVVDLEAAKPNGRHRRVRCLTTLEPDGSVSCFAADEVIYRTTGTGGRPNADADCPA